MVTYPDLAGRSSKFRRVNDTSVRYTHNLNLFNSPFKSYEDFPSVNNTKLTVLLVEQDPMLNVESLWR